MGKELSSVGLEKRIAAEAFTATASQCLIIGEQYWYLSLKGSQHSEGWPNSYPNQLGTEQPRDSAADWECCLIFNLEGHFKTLFKKSTK